MGIIVRRICLSRTSVGEDKEDAPAAGPKRRHFAGASVPHTCLTCANPPIMTDGWDLEGVTSVKP